MNRRSYLSAVGSGVAAGLSGCIGPLNDILRENNNSTQVDPEENISLRLPIGKDVIDNRHEINPPAEDNWNPHYLGENLDVREDLTFRTIMAEPADPGILSISDSVNNNEFIAQLVNSKERESDLISDDILIDYSNNAMLFIESGYPASNLNHEWVGMKKIREDFYRLFGYYRIPKNKQVRSQKTSSAVAVPKGNEYLVTLTVNGSVSVNFKADDGLVGFDRL